MFRGAEKAFIEMGPPESIPRHGVDGFGDLEWPTQPDLSFVQDERASSAMRRLVAKVCVGRLYLIKHKHAILIHYIKSTPNKSHSYAAVP